MKKLIFVLIVSFALFTLNTVSLNATYYCANAENNTKYCVSSGNGDHCCEQGDIWNCVTSVNVEIPKTVD